MDGSFMMSFLASYLELKARAGGTWEAGQILSCGTMVGSAGVYLLAADNSIFHATTLSLFVMAFSLFHGLHLEPYIRYGLYTGPTALVFLLLVVIFTSHDSRKDLARWMPLFFVCTSLVTAALHEALWHSRVVYRWPRDIAMGDRDPETGERTDMADDADHPAGSSNFLSLVGGRRPASRQSSFHQSDILRGVQGPPSCYCYSHQTTHTESNFTLGGPSCPGPPLWPEHWPPAMRCFWTSNDAPERNNIDPDTGQGGAGLPTPPSATSMLIFGHGRQGDHPPDDIDDDAGTHTLAEPFASVVRASVAACHAYGPLTHKHHGSLFSSLSLFFIRLSLQILLIHTYEVPT